MRFRGEAPRGDLGEAGGAVVDRPGRPVAAPRAGSGRNGGAGRLAAGEGDGRRVDDDRGLDLPIFTVLGFQKTVRNFQQLLRKLSLSFFLGDASKQLPFERFSKFFENIVIFKSLESMRPRRN